MDKIFVGDDHVGVIVTNVYIGEGHVTMILPYLTGEETKVFLYALCKAGAPNGKAWISLRKFCENCGLCIATVRKCLEELEVYRIVMIDKQNDPQSNIGRLFRICALDEVDIPGLIGRDNHRRARDQEKMQKARIARNGEIR